MSRNLLPWAAGCAVWLATAASAQPLTVQPFTGNGVLAWNDISTAFAPVQSHTVEWAPRLEGTNTVWREFVTIPATNASFGISLEQAQQVAPLAVQALMAGYAGDEQPDAQTQATIVSMIQSPEPLHTLGMLLWGIWSDLPPADNVLHLPRLWN